MRDIAVELAHRPGELARLSAVLSHHRVNLKAVVGMAIGPHVIIRFIPDDIEAARAAFDSASIRFEESDLVQIRLENRPGELASVSALLAEHGVNLRAIYLTSVAEQIVELAIVPDNASHARRVIELAGVGNLRRHF